MALAILGIELELRRGPQRHLKRVRHNKHTERNHLGGTLTRLMLSEVRGCGGVASERQFLFSG